jgi:hypothetical protein
MGSRRIEGIESCGDVAHIMGVTKKRTDVSHCVLEGMARDLLAPEEHKAFDIRSRQRPK